MMCASSSARFLSCGSGSMVISFVQLTPAIDLVPPPTQPVHSTCISMSATCRVQQLPLLVESDTGDSIHSISPALRSPDLANSLGGSCIYQGQ